MWLCSLHLRNIIHRLALNAGIDVAPKRIECLRRHHITQALLLKDICPPQHPTAADVAAVAAPAHVGASEGDEGDDVSGLVDEMATWHLQDKEGMLLTLAVGICAGAYDPSTGQLTRDVSSITEHVLMLPDARWRGIACTLVWLGSNCIGLCESQDHRVSLLHATRALLLCMCACEDGKSMRRVLRQCRQQQDEEGSAGKDTDSYTTHVFTSFYTVLGHVTLLLELLGVADSTAFDIASAVVDASAVAKAASSVPVQSRQEWEQLSQRLFGSDLAKTTFSHSTLLLDLAIPCS